MQGVSKTALQLHTKSIVQGVERWIACTPLSVQSQKHYFSASGTLFCETLSEQQGLVRTERTGKFNK
jgi:hypothetical protein